MEPEKNIENGLRCVITNWEALLSPPSAAVESRAEWVRVVATVATSPATSTRATSRPRPARRAKKQLG